MISTSILGQFISKPFINLWRFVFTRGQKLGGTSWSSIGVGIILSIKIDYLATNCQKYVNIQFIKIRSKNLKRNTYSARKNQRISSHFQYGRQGNSWNRQFVKRQFVKRQFVKFVFWTIRKKIFVILRKFVKFWTIREFFSNKKF